MLSLRPNCEYCDKDLPPDATEARICTYECTFCADCVETRAARTSARTAAAASRRGPSARRPSAARACRVGAKRPPSAARVHLAWDRRELAAFIEAVRAIPPERR